ncbi:MAG: hypothetical protein M1840_005666 [Geoglossum simile]|nr:MAG: hypothetical protein M1840_005666 [Geoglossum simile]
MASSEANPKNTSTSPTPRAGRPFGLEDDPAVSSASDSLQIGPKGESSFAHLSELSLGRTAPKAASPLLGHRTALGKISISWSGNIQEDRPVPPGSPDRVASLQILTPKGSTGNEEELEVVDEIWDKTANMYKIVVSPGKLVFLSLVPQAEDAFEDCGKTLRVLACWQAKIESSFF